MVSTVAHDLARGHLDRALTVIGHVRADAAPLVDHHAGVLAAMVELEVVSVAEAAEWSAAVERAARALTPAPPETRARAQALLEDELEASAAMPRDTALEQRERFTNQLQALLEAGVVAPDEGRAWTERLDRAIPHPPMPHGPPAPDCGELRAVLVGPGDRVGGPRVNSVEMFDDCVIVRWHLVAVGTEGQDELVNRIDRAGDLARVHGPTTLRDDAGTSYAMAPSIHGARADFLHLTQDPETLPGASAFIPEVPGHASRLTVGCRAGTFEFNLLEPDVSSSDG